MNAIHSNGDDREREELRRAQRAHKPRMQDILDSLVALIADDKDSVLNAPPPRAPRRRPAAAASGPIAYSKDAPAPRPSGEKRRDEAATLSPAAEAAVASAFDTLCVTAQRAEASEEMTRELLRPMLKAWLEEHLPRLVQPLVRAEIERAARGSRGGASRTAGGRPGAA